MSDGVFVFEDCLLKHHIRNNVWLPLSRQRLSMMRKVDSKHPRRLRYFTFCAVGAIDVLMLEKSRIIRRSNDGRMNNVCFFDHSVERVDQTAKRIPGAIGLPGDFLKVVWQMTRREMIQMRFFAHRQTPRILRRRGRGKYC